MRTETNSQDKHAVQIKISARDESRKLALLVAINMIHKPTEKDLIAATGIPQRSIHAMFSILARMDVVIQRVKGRRYGFYEIANEGPYNLDRAQKVIRQNYPETFYQIERHANLKSEAGSSVKITLAAGGN